MTSASTPRSPRIRSARGECMIRGCGYHDHADVLMTTRLRRRDSTIHELTGSGKVIVWGVGVSVNVGVSERRRIGETSAFGETSAV